MELIVELIVWFIIEVVFWGIMFWTGYVLTLIVTLGQWTPKHTERDKDKKKESRRETKFIVTAIIGTLFWIGFGITLIIVMKNP
jgi:hypothetical protein